MNDKNAEQLKKVRNKRRDLDIKAAAAAVAIAAAGFAATPLMGQTMPEKSKDDHSTTVVQNQDMARFESLMKRFQEKSDISQKDYVQDSSVFGRYEVRPKKLFRAHFATP